MSDAPPRLRVRGLARDYGSGRGLHGLDLEIQPGEIVGLLGPNGSGKSTALAALAGLLPADAGEIWIDGKACRPDERDYRASLGVVFQQASLDVSLTARENLRLSLRMQGFDRRFAAARAAELLESEELLDRADQRLSEFSGGMRRRVDLLRAVAHEPRLLLMDEPSAGLDERSFRKLWTSIDRRRRTQGVSVLVATHRPDEAARCDRLVVLASGRVIARGEPEELVGRLQADRLEIELLDRSALAAVQQRISDAFSVDAFLVDDGIVVPCNDGPRLLIRVIEELGQGVLRSAKLRRPGLADVFFELAGRTLDEDEEPLTGPARGAKNRAGGRAA